MISDLNKGISEIKYNHLNLPTEISWTGSSNKIRYVYNAAGQKVKKTVVDGTTTKIVDYLDGFQYAGEVLQFFPHPEGYVKATPANKSLNSPSTSYSYNYVYNYTDHLGNVRLSYSKNPATNLLNILEENHYYPFGLKHEVYVSGGKRDYRAIPDDNDPRLVGVTKTDYQYKYNGKELQDELGLGLYDYGWRDYDPAIGRFSKIDRFAEKYHDKSPYNYAANNPVFFIDPDGMAPTTDYFDSKGKFVKRVDDGKTDVKIYASNTNRYVSPSKLDNSKGSLKALANVTAHYARDEGFTGGVNVTTAKGDGSAFYSGGDITVRKSTFDEGHLDSYGNLSSVVNHEIDHDINPVGSFKDHADTYMREASNSDFKDATDDYKINNSNQFMNRILNSYDESEINYNQMKSAVDTYNKNNVGGVKVGYPSILGSMKGASFKTTLNGKSVNNGFKFKKLDDVKK